MNFRGVVIILEYINKIFTGKSEELPEEEIEKMLDEDLPPELKEAPKPKEKPYVTRTKIVLEGR